MSNDPAKLTIESEKLSIVYELSLDRQRRRANGSHYTPVELAAFLVRQTLAPLLARGQDPLRVRVLDPACGTGALLVAACNYLSERLIEHRCNHLRYDEAHRLVQRYCLLGLDIDAEALEIARRRLPHLPPQALRLADALTEPLEPVDAVVGNPPFLNAIEGRLPEQRKAWLRGRYPEVRGAADLAYYFVARSHEVVRPDGTIGLILPRAFLNAPAADSLRQRLLEERPPTTIFCPEDAHLFHATNVRITALVLGGGSVCVGGSRLPLRPWKVCSCNWWQPLTRAKPSLKPTERLHERFEVIASMTAAMAYELLPYLTDEATGTRPRLLTTGLIDPSASLWGKRRCRYLKSHFQHPRIRLDPSMPTALQRRLKQVARPKLLVAGVAGPGHRLESLLDRGGHLVGAVSTFSIFDPDDDLYALERLEAYLNSASVGQHVVEQLVARAMGAGLTTITKEFLRGLPLPSAISRQGRASL